MHLELEEIPTRIFSLAIAALTQANMHSVYMDPGTEHWQLMSVLNAAHAGELFIKAIIAKEHPLLIFKDIFNFDDSRADTLNIDMLLKKGRTHDFEKLPQILWVTTGQRIPDMESFEKLRQARNAIQHFCAPDETDFSGISLRFIYNNLDPLIHSNFNIYAIQYHEDFSVSYDYIVAALVKLSLIFTLPSDFDITEVDLADLIRRSSRSYKDWFYKELERIGKTNLLKNS